MDGTMTSIKLYHNPRCSKSRQTLALMEERDIEHELVVYLDNPPTIDELKSILVKLNMTPRDIIRTGETEYKENNLQDTSITDAELVDAIVAAPILMQRPIVVTDTSARIGRPPESVLEIL